MAGVSQVNSLNFATKCFGVALTGIALTSHLTHCPAQDEPSGLELKSAVLKTLALASVPSLVDGVIVELTVEEGVSVKRGQTLGKLDDESVRLKLQQLRHQVEIAKAKETNDIDLRLAIKRKEVASTEYERALAANDRVADTYPRNELDRLRLIAEQSELEVERAEFTLEMDRLATKVAESEYEQAYALYGRHRLKASIDGTVVDVKQHVGEWVASGTEVLRLINVRKLRAEGLVPASEGQQSLIGRSAVVSLVANQRITARGRVTFVSPQANPINSLVRVFVQVDNRDELLRPGLPVRVRIEEDSIESSDHTHGKQSHGNKSKRNPQDENDEDVGHRIADQHETAQERAYQLEPIHE